MRVKSIVPLNCEASIKDLNSNITSTSSFYVRNHFPSPDIGPSGWRLVVESQSANLSYTLEELNGMDQRALGATLECAGNGRVGFGKKIAGEIEWGNGAVGTAIWKGVSLRTILEKSGFSRNRLDRITEAIFVGADGSTENSTPIESKMRYARSFPIKKALDQDTIVALRMNGEPIPIDHGYPARLIVPGWYGMASVKWLNRIILTATRTPFEGYFTSTKYVYQTDRKGMPVREPVTNVRVKALITKPEAGQLFGVGEPISVEGKAWSGFGRITKVEVNLGDGWKRASLVKNDELGKYAWTAWKTDWIPRQRGKVMSRVRATDEKNNVQLEQPTMNRYQYGYNAIQHVEIQVK